MYIFEAVFKYLNSKFQPKYQNSKDDSYNYEKCDHVFLPIDSTKETLACNKCGLIIKSNTLPKKKKNFFLDK